MDENNALRPPRSLAEDENDALRPPRSLVEDENTVHLPHKKIQMRRFGFMYSIFGNNACLLPKM